MESPIYPDDPDRSASLLVAVEYYESRFSPQPPAGSSRCMAQLSSNWIGRKASVRECLSTAARLLRMSIERYGDLRAYTHRMPYPKFDSVGWLRLRLAARLLKERND